MSAFGGTSETSKSDKPYEAKSWFTQTQAPEVPLTAHTRPTTVLDNTSDNPGRVLAGLGYWASGPACIRANSTRAPRWDAEPV